MIRVLVLIAVTGFVVALASLTAAFAIGGPDLLSSGGWAIASKAWPDGHHSWAWRHGDWDRDFDDDHGGREATRTFAWTGSDELEVEIPATIIYTQVAGPGSVTVTGPARIVDDVELHGGSIDADGRHSRRMRRVTIEVKAPAVTKFHLSGANRLTLNDYNQPHLRIETSGTSQVDGRGKADTVELDISGSGEIDLSDLTMKGADVEISGSGEATVGPTEWAKLDISGAGEVNLTSTPQKVESEVSGAGRIHEANPPPQAPAAPPPPARPGRKS